LNRRHPPRPASRSRPLRKKLHVDEFRECGFRLRFVLSPAEQAHEGFWGDFLAEAIEAQALLYAGSEDGFVCAERGTTTEAHRRLVEDWLQARPEVAEVVVGPRVDAWYEDAVAT